MFAVVKTGGKQYRVTENQILIIEKILGEEGTAHTFDNVLLLEDGSQVTVGKPLVDGAKVVASIVEQTRGDKVIIFKKKRRHTYRRKKGHRQELTVLRVVQIAKPGESVRALAPKAAAVKPALPQVLDAAAGHAEATQEAQAPKKPARSAAQKTEAAVEKGSKAEKKAAPSSKKTSKE